MIDHINREKVINEFLDHIGFKGDRKTCMSKLKSYKYKEIARPLILYHKRRGLSIEQLRIKYQLKYNEVRWIVENH